MKTITSHKQAIDLARQQVNAQDLINGRLCTDEGWEDVELSWEYRKELAQEVADILGGWNVTKKSICNNILNGKPQHWGLSRVILESYNDNPRLYYCAGQDYPSELATIRKALK